MCKISGVRDGGIRMFSDVRDFTFQFRYILLSDDSNCR